MGKESKGMQRQYDVAGVVVVYRDNSKSNRYSNVVGIGGDEIDHIILHLDENNFLTETYINRNNVLTLNVNRTYKIIGNDDG